MSQFRKFFADCDAVLLCLDPEGSTGPGERLRRQQEVEKPPGTLYRRLPRRHDRPARRPPAHEVRPRDDSGRAGDGGELSVWSSSVTE